MRTLSQSCDKTRALFCFKLNASEHEAKQFAKGKLRKISPLVWWLQCRSLNGSRGQTEYRDSPIMKCALCEDTAWVRENHPDTPWEGAHACTCGGAGMPCPKCNPSDLDNSPRSPAGTRVEFDKDGSRH
jgi:hypothetical protein